MEESPKLSWFHVKNEAEKLNNYVQCKIYYVNKTFVHPSPFLTYSRHIWALHHLEIDGKRPTMIQNVSIFRKNFTSLKPVLTVSIHIQRMKFIWWSFPHSQNAFSLQQYHSSTPIRNTLTNLLFKQNRPTSGFLVVRDVCLTRKMLSLLRKNNS